MAWRACRRARGSCRIRCRRANGRRRRTRLARCSPPSGGCARRSAWADVERAAAGKLTIAVECSRLPHDVRGIGRYVRALLPRLLAQREELQLIPFARRRAEVDALRETLTSLGLTSERVAPRQFGEMSAGDADLWWYPWNVARPTLRGAK